MLRALTEAGLVRRIQPAGATARYEAGSATTTTTWCAARAAPSPTSTAPSAHAPCLTASDDHGFTVDEAEVVYWGTCPACATTPIPQRSHSPEGTR